MWVRPSSHRNVTRIAGTAISNGTTAMAEPYTSSNSSSASPPPITVAASTLTPPWPPPAARSCDGGRAAVEVDVPAVLEQFALGDRVSLAPEQVLEHHDLAGGQVQRSAIASGGPAGRVQDQAARRQDGRPGTERPAGQGFAPLPEPPAHPIAVQARHH